MGEMWAEEAVFKGKKGENLSHLVDLDSTNRKYLGRTAICSKKAQKLT
jgi:hypothetical protein